VDISSTNSQTSNLNKIRPAVAELFHADRQTEKNLIGAIPVFFFYLINQE